MNNIHESIILKALAEESKNNTKYEDISQSSNFDDIGLDSLSVVTAVMAIEDTLGILLSPKEMGSVVDVTSLFGMVKYKLIMS